VADGTGAAPAAPDRPEGEWPAWVDDVLRYGPIAELEVEWRAAIGDAITRVLDARKQAIESATPPDEIDAPPPGL
jgi:hypothetical protein